MDKCFHCGLEYQPDLSYLASALDGLLKSINRLPNSKQVEDMMCEAQMISAFAKGREALKRYRKQGRYELPPDMDDIR